MGDTGNGNREGEGLETSAVALVRSGGKTLAYADPPYPGLAYLYPENEEVDHVSLVARLCTYDGWALSTSERALNFVLNLCPPGVRIAAWCRSNAPPFAPNPSSSWEPVIISPARTRPVVAASYYVGGVPSGGWQRDGLTGQKTPGFCEWVIRCLGAERDDELHDLFPGTGTMGEAWERFRNQPPLFRLDARGKSAKAVENERRRFHPTLPGIAAGTFVRERRVRIPTTTGDGDQAVAPEASPGDA